MPTEAQATPSISVSSSGLITASATQTAGYVAAGTKSATKQLTTQATKTWTPTTANQTIAASTYLTGKQTIKGDANLVAENIKSGVSIFGVSGTLASGPEKCTLTFENNSSNVYSLIILEFGEDINTDVDVLAKEVVQIETYKHSMFVIININADGASVRATPDSSSRVRISSSTFRVSTKGYAAKTAVPIATEATVYFSN